VRHLVELHGGRVSADSPGEGQGSTFTVRLPVALIKRPAKGEGPIHTALSESLLALPHLKQLRVLVVDDEPDARAAISEILSQAEA